MPHVIIFSPLIDIALVSIAFNLFAYTVYAYVYGKDFKQIASVDLRLSIVEILLVVANYATSGTVITVLGILLPWWLWYIIASVPAEVAFFLAYKRYFKLSWNDIAGSGWK